MRALPPGVKAALLAAGGCEHMPEPWAACDTCGRQIPPWALNGQLNVAAYDWQAKTVDGLTMDKRDLLSVDNLPKDKVATLTATTSSPRAPVIRAVVDPRRGERLHMLTRHLARMGVNGTGQAKMSVVVLQVTPDPSKPEQVVSLYVHPHCLILSTQDLYF